MCRADDVGVGYTLLTFSTYCTCPLDSFMHK